VTLWSRLERRLSDLADEFVLDEYRDQIAQARQLLGADDARGAAEVLEAMLRIKADHGQAWTLLGEARLSLREPHAAHVAFARALALRGNDPEALVGLGTAQIVLAQFREAIHSLASVVAEAGGDRAILAEAYRGLGTAWRRLGDTDKAIRELRKAVAEDTTDLETRAALAEALVADGGSVEEARRHLERVEAASSLPVLAAMALGAIAIRERSPALASGHFRAARDGLEHDHTPLGRLLRLEAIIGQGDSALQSRDAMAAHGHYLEALQLEPRRADLHAMLAAAHRAIGSNDAALVSYQRALALGGGLDILRAALDLAILAGDAQCQTQWANDLLEHDPDDSRALVARGLGLAASGQTDAAKALLSLAAARDDLDARFGLARLALAADPLGAVEQTLAALRTAPYHLAGRNVLEDARTRTFPPLPEHPAIDEVARSLESAVASRPELGHLVGEVSRASNALDQPLLVTVMGEFSSGKSSFVNAFIGAEVAPTGITPTTATINVVRYGRERCGRIIGHDSSVRELSWESLFPYLRSMSAETARAIDRVEILLPLPQLEKINIVDTPGLNSIQPEHEATARAFIARADAVVWVFTSNQGGKASERAALTSIRAEGKRVLGVLNKSDQLSPADLQEVIAFIGQSLQDLVEVVVPFSARLALAHKTLGIASDDDGNWAALSQALEERFFAQARLLKRQACTRRLRAVVVEASASLDAARARADAASEIARRGRDTLGDATRTFVKTTILAERRTLSEAVTALYRLAAREVLELVRPRRLPFSAHSATAADRDYLISLLAAGYDHAVDESRRRMTRELLLRAAILHDAAVALGAAAGADVRDDLSRATHDRVQLATAQVFDRARAYLHGFLEGGYVDAFFRNDVPRLELSEDSVYHALVRGAPDLDRDIAAPMERAVTEVMAALAHRLDYWSGVVEIVEFDLEIGLGRILSDISSHLIE
jgi:Tfp pilus assembly protein PilF/GTPase SAR1 family protein